MKRFSVVMAALVAAGLLCGCATFHAGRGDRAVLRGDWDAAFESYRSAASHDPENLELRYKLAGVRREAARVHRVAGARAQESREFGEAIAELEASLRYEEHAPTRQHLEQARDAKRRADAGLAMTEGARLEAARDLAAARDAYTRATDLDPELVPEARKRIAPIEKAIGRAQALAAQANTRLASNDFNAASRIAEQALAIHVAEPTALAVADSVRSEREAEASEQAARAAEADLAYGVAVESARLARDTRSTPSRVALVERLEERAFRHFAREGERAFEREDWSEAIESFELARRYGGDPGALESALQDAHYENAYERGLHAERHHHVGDALEHYRRAYDLRPSESLAKRIWRLEHPEPEKHS